MSDTAAVQRVGQWWSGLDPNMKSLFEQIYAEQPELVVRVLSGGTVSLPEEAPTLDEMFAVDALAPSVIPNYGMAGNPEIDPAYPEVNTPFTVTYSLTNLGTDAPAERIDDVRILDAGQQVVAEEQATGLALPNNGSESMQVTFANGVPVDGRYAVEVWVNVNGTPWGAPPNEHGSQTAAGTSLVVGSYETEAGPVLPEHIFREAAFQLADDASGVQGSNHSGATMLEPFRQFVTRAQTLINAGVADFPEWGASQKLSGRIDMLVGWVDRIDPDRDVYGEWPRAEAEEAAVNLQQAALPFARLPYSEELLDDYMPDVLAAAEALLNCYRR